MSYIFLCVESQSSVYSTFDAASQRNISSNFTRRPAWCLSRVLFRVSFSSWIPTPLLESNSCLNISSLSQPNRTYLFWVTVQLSQRTNFHACWWRRSKLPRWQTDKRAYKLFKMHEAWLTWNIPNLFIFKLTDK